MYKINKPSFLSSLLIRPLKLLCIYLMNSAEAEILTMLHWSAGRAQRQFLQKISSFSSENPSLVFCSFGINDFTSIK